MSRLRSVVILLAGLTASGLFPGRLGSGHAQVLPHGAMQASNQAIVSAHGSVSRQQVSVGGSVTLTATVVSRTLLRHALVDLEVDNKTKQVFQQVQVIGLPAGQTVHVVRVFAPAQSTPAGPYTFKIGVFSRHWHKLYAWNDHAARFHVV